MTVESYVNVQAAWPYRADLDCVVEAPDGSFAAYALAWLDAENAVGELEPVGTHPDHRRRGLASAPSACSRSTGCASKARPAQSSTRAADEPAKALYESIGFREHARSLTLVKRRAPPL